MGRVNASDLRAGMVLASDAVGTNGRLLLPKGTTLEEQHIRVLKIWGALDADIQHMSGDEASQASLDDIHEEHLKAARNFVDCLFDDADLTIHPMHELHTACIKLYGARAEAGQQLSPDAFNWTPIPHPDNIPQTALNEFVSTDRGLASFPDIYFRINNALEDPSSTANKLADVISKDPSISAKLLSLVNSPFYGFGQRIDSLSRSVALVGAREISQLALGVAVMDLFIGVPDGLITVRGFWQHSVACGVLSRILASHITGMQQERCFVIGLLHDIGRLVMLKLAPQHVAWALNQSRTEHIPLNEAEQFVFGFDHTDVAEALFKRWNLPEELLDGVASHHDNDALPPREAAVCATADTLAIAMGYGANGSITVRTIPPAVWQSLDLPDSVLEATMLAAERQIHDITSIFLN
ncbi:HDOD domain-containing protein [Desulfovibrio mangrovi]|uniref:HDOD domain-containing protein n=1 Tax=Desulfovibrio mangrovi TaxID=2976983 RepID=UPI002245BECB|nr:HDOD domain-containing protein [Desulfovibrio mangrovi]UZP66984.1 HDOD domain-containing protein [Desulfovibrio mangrovi]